MSCLRTIRPSGCSVSEKFVLRTFSLLRMFCSRGHFVSRTLSLKDVSSQRCFVSERFITVHFVSGGMTRGHLTTRTICLRTFCPGIEYSYWT